MIMGRLPHILIALALGLSASAALAMPGATVGIATGSPDPFGTASRPLLPRTRSLPRAEGQRMSNGLG